MIILASNSLLRAQIMELAGIPFKVEASDVDERAIEERHHDKSPREIVEILAKAKADDVAKRFPEDIVIAADTFGSLESGARFHKASTFEETIAMALSQSGKTTIVNTGVAIVHGEQKRSFTTTTKIAYVDFDEQLVRRLFDNNESAKRRNASLGFYMDAPGFTLVQSIEGSYLGAMGLPIEVIRPLLDETS